jgi:5'-nucleotidase / UDP-sugar diphosphatase
MKKTLKGICSLLIVTLILSLSIPAYSAENSGKSLTILFTHDMHDHFLPAQMDIDGVNMELGGYARLSSAIKAEKEKDKNLILLDAGDFSMGTLFQSIYASDAPELRTLGQLGYDAVTLGNHEFDFRADGLADSLNAAKASLSIKNEENKLPEIVASNIEFPVEEKAQLTDSLSKLKKAMGDYGVKEYTIIERNGLKIGIFGAMGKDSISNAPMAEVGFRDEIEVSKTLVKKLKDAEKVDLVVCLSHAGIDPDKSKSEDEILAKEVPGIDIIISGHTHSTLSKPIIVGNTIIGSAGEYCKNLGVIKISKTSNNKWELNNYSLKPIDNKLVEDQNISWKIIEYKKIVQDKYLNKFDLKFDEILAQTSYDFTPTSKIGVKHQEDTLGNLITDAFIYAVKKAEGANYEPVTMALVPAGTIRGSFVKGNITVSDAFTVSSLGIGADKISGYPLISVYLTGKELKTACEVDASIAPIMPSAQLYMSGVSFTFNPNRLIFNKVTKAELQKPDGSTEKIDNKKLYRVVVGLYSAQMLTVVGSKSFGLLSVVPKTKDGKAITDFEAQIIKDTASGRNNEVKEWLAVAEYLKSFDKVNGVSQVPNYYSKTHNRKIVDDTHNVIALIANPNAIALGALAIVIVILALIILAVYLLATRKKRKSKRITKRLKQM